MPSGVQPARTSVLDTILKQKRHVQKPFPLKYGAYSRFKQCETDKYNLNV